MIPRGNKALIERVRDQAAMPVVAGGVGICHTYIDRQADLEMALDIVDNAKTRRVSICNALDVIIPPPRHRPAFPHPPGAALEPPDPTRRAGSNSAADPDALQILVDTPAKTRPAGEGDFDTEFLSLTAAVRVADSADHALQHIAPARPPAHSEAVVTSDPPTRPTLPPRSRRRRRLPQRLPPNSPTADNSGWARKSASPPAKSTPAAPWPCANSPPTNWVVRGDGHTRPL